MSSSDKFYSRFSLNGSQPYLLTHEYSQTGMSIPGMSWVPDFSLTHINEPNLIYHGPPMDFVLNQASQICHKETQCGYQFWKTPKAMK